MCSIKPLEQIIENEKTLRLLEVVGYYFRYAENARIELDELTNKFRDIVLEPYRCNGNFEDEYEIIRRIDSVLLGRSTKENLIEFIRNRQD